MTVTNAILVRLKLPHYDKTVFKSCWFFKKNQYISAQNETLTALILGTGSDTEFQGIVVSIGKKYFH